MGIPGLQNFTNDTKDHLYYNENDNNLVQQQQQQLISDKSSTQISIHTQQPQRKISNIDSYICRICHNYDKTERFISPCLCKGSLRYVHLSCLEQWLSGSGMCHCEVCMHQYETDSTLRYKCCESLQIWYRHPNNRGLLQSDCMLCCLLSLITFGLIALSLFGLHHFVDQENSLGLSKIWTLGSVLVFLLIVVVAYCLNVFLILRSQLRPWFRWWQTTKSVRVLITDFNESQQKHQQIDIDNNNSDNNSEPSYVEVIINP